MADHSVGARDEYESEASEASVFFFDNRELKHRRFWATAFNRKTRLLLFDAYLTLFIQKVKL